MISRSGNGIAVFAILLTLLVMAFGTATAMENYCRAGGDEGFVPSSSPLMQSRGASHNYEGRIRLYVVEPNSRYISQADLKPYQYGFLDWGYDTTISLPYQDSLVRTLTWNGASVGFGNVQENNIMVIAVAFNNEWHQGYSNPDNIQGLGLGPFDAYYVDATAAARVDTQWVDTAYGSYTHRAFIEEATATTCPYCPNTRKALDGIYKTHTYPFFYAAMVGDVNDKADQRLNNELGDIFVPECYFDGGFEVHVGGDVPWAPYTTHIVSAAQRPVHDLDLSVAITWLGSAQIQIDLKVKNNQWLNEAPGAPDTLCGPDTAVTGKNYDFATIATDAENDSRYYRFYWQDGDTSEWYGPYVTDDTCKITHNFSTPASYNVMAQAKDEWNESGEWSPAKAIKVYGFVAGDADHSGIVNALDVTRVINFLYKHGATPNPPEAGDANGNGVTNALDVTYLINFLYKGGARPKYPPGV